ncbi:MAG: hypothetical protein PVI09_16340 [Anaerolineae bacterium]|jgi:hypothetical protein
MATERQRYLAYMLRLWRIGEDRVTWRVSLENAHTGACQGFASLQALFLFLQKETGLHPAATGQDSVSGLEEGQGRQSEPDPET